MGYYWWIIENDACYYIYELDIMISSKWLNDYKKLWKNYCSRHKVVIPIVCELSFLLFSQFLYV